ncbi:MAG: hypothetical protein B7W98_02270, partial [Parcubacteria group bacterium 20-58-5]
GAAGAGAEIDAVVRPVGQPFGQHGGMAVQVVHLRERGGVLERELMLLLMGIDTPDEFMKALAEEARLDQKIITGIVQDINTQVFVPLREEEEKGGVASAAPSAAPRPMAAPMPPRPPAPHGAGGQPETHFHLQNKIIPPPRPPQPSSPIPKLATPPRPLAAAPAGVSNRPGLRDALAAVTKVPEQPPAARLLEDHEEPHIELGKTPLPAQSRPSTPPAHPPGALPSQVIQPGARPAFAPTPKIVPPAAPQASAGPAVPKVAPPPMPPKPAAVPPPAAPAVPAKPYAADPYREPIEP